MKRGIRFRAWDGKIMRYANKEQFVIRFDGVIGSFNGETYDTVEWPIMQFTGRKDKNDVDIYEGDIIAWDYEYDADYDGDMPIVKRSTGKAPIKDIFDLYMIRRAAEEGKGCEVIGNIYQDPELL